MTDSGDVVTVERFIPASADRIFALIADPNRHHDIDGSGTVRDAKNVPAKLELGSKFGMSMKLGIPYSMESTVIEYEQDRRLAWQTRPPGRIPGKLAGGRIWRYELEPVDGGTRVRESWDISEDHQRSMLRKDKVAAQTRANMEKTLEKIAALVSQG